MAQINPYSRKNFLLIALNGILFRLGAVFIEVNTILPLFIKTISNSSVLVGLVNSMGKAGWFLPQIFSAHLIDDRPYKKPLYVKCAILRGISIAVIPIIVINYRALGNLTVLWLLLLIYGIYAIAGGMSGVAGMDIIGRTVRSDKRALLFSLRWGIGGILAVGGGYSAKIILKKLAFPNNFALLFAIAAAIIDLALFTFILVDEPPAPVSKRGRDSLWRFIVSGVKLLSRDRNYRNLYITRAFMGLWSGALPFYILYARKELDVAAYYAGLFAMAQSLGQILPNAVWGPLGRKYGNQKIIQVGASFTAFMPAIALIVRHLPQYLWIPSLWIMFFVGALALNGIIVGSMSYMLDISPDDARSKYIGTFNTLISPWMFVPMIAGALLDTVGFKTLFFASFVTGIGAAVVSSRLTPGRY